MRDSTRLAVTAAVSAVVTSVVLVVSGIPASSVTAGQPDDTAPSPNPVCGSLRADAGYAAEKAELGGAAACANLQSRSDR